MPASLRSILLLVLSVLLFAGCDVREKERASLLTEAVTAYGTAIRWQEYEFARSLLAPRDGSEPAAIPAVMKSIRVTGWSAGEIVMQPDGEDAWVSVRFSFYDGDSGRVAEVVDRQTWYFRENGRRWLLDGGFPDFSGALGR